MITMTLTQGIAVFVISLACSIILVMNYDRLFGKAER
jgi:hypothetical protein